MVPTSKEGGRVGSYQIMVCICKQLKASSLLQLVKRKMDIFIFFILGLFMIIFFLKFDHLYTYKYIYKTHTQKDVGRLWYTRWVTIGHTVITLKMFKNLTVKKINFTAVGERHFIIFFFTFLCVKNKLFCFVK